MWGHLTALTSTLLVLTGLTVGFMGSFSGLGGAIVLTPVLAIGFGLPYHTAIGCTVAQTIGMSAVAMLRHHRLGHLDLPLAANFIAGSVPGAMAGRWFLQRLNDAYGSAPWLRASFNVLYVGLLVAGAILVIARVMRRRVAHPVPSGSETDTGEEGPVRMDATLLRRLTVWIAGILAGGLAGLLAIGGGLVAVPVLNGLLAVPITTAVGTSILQMVFTTTAATFVSVGTSDLDLRVIALLLLGSLPGAALGPWLLHRLAGRQRF